MTRRTSAPLQAPILARDADGNEHLLSVTDHPAGFVSISDDTMVRTLSPIATVALVLALIHALGSHLPVRPGSGPFSSAL